MAVPKLEYTPVVSPRGRRVHAVALMAPGAKAVCGAPRPASGWRVALRPLGCTKCKAKMHLPVRRPE